MEGQLHFLIVSISLYLLTTKISSARFLNYVYNRSFTSILSSRNYNFFVISPPDSLNLNSYKSPDLMNSFIPFSAHISSELSLNGLRTNILLFLSQLFVHYQFECSIVKSLEQFFLFCRLDENTKFLLIVVYKTLFIVVLCRFIFESKSFLLFSVETYFQILFTRRFERKIMNFEGIWYILLDSTLVMASSKILFVFEILFKPTDSLRCWST